MQISYFWQGHKKGRDVRAVLMIFFIELKYSFSKFLGWLYMKYVKRTKMVACSGNFHCGGDFDAILAILRSFARVKMLLRE